MSLRWYAAASLTVLLLITTTGCEGQRMLMPTPNVYARGVDPFPDVPEALRNNRVDVLYLTDRQPENEDRMHRKYGYGRSRSVAYGVCEVQLGQGMSWDELASLSRTDRRPEAVPVTVGHARELGRFPPTPRALVEPLTTAQGTDAAGPKLSGMREEHDVQLAAAEALLSAALARSPEKEVFLFVHGYNNSFDYAVATIAQVWHFMGRRGVPVAYTWPAGHGGLLRGYTYDRESSEFTVYHMKEALRALAANPDVQKINVIAHSRGTDVATSALRELHIEMTAAGRSTREALKLGTLVLAAPDMDIDVVIQRLMTVRLARVPERCALYVCNKDEALGISGWLFGGGGRLGRLRSDIFSSAEMEALRASTTVQVVDARVTSAGAFGHDYFHTNPAVSSDLILLMRYGKGPGEAEGRPLRIHDGGFWVVDDDYPRPAPSPKTAPAHE